MNTRLFLIPFFVIGISCESNMKDSDKNLESKMRKLEKQDCNQGTCATVLFNFPMIKEDREAAKILNEHIEQQLIMYLQEDESVPIASLDSAVDLFLSGFSDYSESYSTTEQWQVSVNAKVTYQTGNMVSVLFDSYSYKGGAHPNSFQMYLNYDKKKQSLVKKQMLIKLINRISS